MRMNLCILWVSSIYSTTTTGLRLSPHVPSIIKILSIVIEMHLFPIIAQSSTLNLNYQYLTV